MVRDWNDLDGIGVIDSPETPGGCWMSWSALHVAGRETAREGQRVEFSYEQVAQDGYDYRAVRVLLEGVPPGPPKVVREGGAAYQSELHIAFDDER